MKIVFERDKLLNLEFILKKEYLLTNGTGGYCSSTILDCHTRKYHGLLNLRLGRTGKTFNLLSKIETVAVIDEREFELSTNKYPGVFHPAGHQFVEEFSFDLYPRTLYRIGDVELAKSVLMPQGGDSVIIRWEYISGSRPVMLKLLPFLAYREIHGLVRENLYIQPRTFPEENGFKISPYKDMPALFVQTSRTSHFFPSPLWIKDLEYLKERNRGYGYQEDLFSPGVFEADLEKGETLFIRAATGKAGGDIRPEWIDEEKRLATEAGRFAKEKEPLATLKTSAGQFLYDDRSGGTGVIAGFHWFSEWGRDTLIALPGLTACRGEKAAAFSVLERYGRFVKDGLLPNTVSADGSHAYNSADSALLYFWAAQNACSLTGAGTAAAKALLGPMVDIVSGLIAGRSPHVRAGKDGLLYAGDESTNLTWMDASVFGRPVTPRNGAPVEINALWYNALCFLEKEMGKELDPKFLADITARRKHFEITFRDGFFCRETQCLYDVVRHPYSDPAIRPNQLFALGLPYTCVERERAVKVIETVKRSLVTPVGLRTLAPDDPLYRADYTGDQATRDTAYHQGLVWPWLIGIFTDALLKLYPKKEVRDYIYSTFDELLVTHLSRYGLKHVSEIFTPNPPYVAKGCVAQAWSEAEIIRALELLK